MLDSSSAILSVAVPIFHTLFIIIMVGDKFESAAASCPSPLLPIQSQGFCIYGPRYNMFKGLCPDWWWRGEEICIKICHVKFIIVFVDIPFLYPFFEINAIVVIIIIISVTPLFCILCECYFWPSSHLLVIYLMLWSVVLQLLRFYSLLMDKKQLFIPHFCHSIIIYCVVILSYFIHPLSGAIQDLINVFSFHQHLVLLGGIEKVDSTSSLVLQFNADWFPSIVVVAVARHVESSPSFGSLKLNANLFHRISML